MKRKRQQMNLERTKTTSDLDPITNPMRQTLNTIEDLRDFLHGLANAVDNKEMGVLRRAAHHTQSVFHTAQQMVGLVVWLADPDSLRTTIDEAGLPKGNRLWFRVNGQLFVLTHDHADIILKADSTQGNELARFNDLLTSAEVSTQFQDAVGVPRTSV